MSESRKLILTVGLPRSGKSTWALKQECPVVASDAIREAIFGKLWWPPGEHQVMMTARTMVRSLFFAGHNKVIFDSINVTEQSRRFWLPTDDCMWELEHKLVATAPHVCRQRAIDCNQEYLAPVIDQIAKWWEPPEYDDFEGQTKDDWSEYDFYAGVKL